MNFELPNIGYNLIILLGYFTFTSFIIGELDLLYVPFAIAVGLT